MTPTADPVDLVEEFRLRRWARENYCYAAARQPTWHPIVHEEMQRRDTEEVSVTDGEWRMEDGKCNADQSSILNPRSSDNLPTDSTALSDETAIEADQIPDRRLPLMIGPIVPLAPGIPGLHGPHEITPPHTRVAEPAESTELHIG